MSRERKEQKPLYCSGKRAYDKRGAITAANRRYEEDHVRLRIYPCRGHWHLTSIIRPVKYQRYKHEKPNRREEKEV